MLFLNCTGPLQIGGEMAIHCYCLAMTCIFGKVSLHKGFQVSFNSIVIVLFKAVENFN